MATTSTSSTGIAANPFMSEFDAALAFEELDARSSVFDSSGDSSDESSRDSSYEESSDDESSDDVSTTSESSEESTISSCSDESSNFGEAYPDGMPTEVEFTGDDIAIVSSFMNSSKVTSVLGALVERGSLMTSINWLSAHVPTCVLEHIGDEICGTDNFQKNSLASVSERNKKDDSSVFSELSDQQYEPDDAVVHDDCDSINIPRRALHRQNSMSSQRSGAHSQGIENGGHVDSKVLHVDRVVRNGRQSSFLSGMGIQMKRALALETEADGETRQRTRDELVHPELPNVRRASMSLIRKLPVVSEQSDNTIGSGLDGNTRKQSAWLISNTRPMSIQEDNASDDNGMSLEHRLELCAFGIGISRKNGNRANTTSTFLDPFPDDDSDEVKLKQVRAPQESKWRASTTILSGSRRSFRTQRTGEYRQLPHSSTHQCALLFVDISGFTKLATTLDPEHLSKAINSYFQLIINEVTAHSGDVLKFAGDGVFVEWKAISPGSSPGLMRRKQLSLSECMCTAAVCAAKIVAKCTDFPIYAHHAVGSGGQGSQVATLNVHCGLGVGQIVGVHVGDDESRREYVILGDPIDQVCEAVNAASLGEVAASPQAMMTLTKACTLHESLQSVSIDKPVVISTGAVSLFNPRVTQDAQNGHKIPPLALSQVVESWRIESLKQYQKLMSLYAHPVVVANDTSKQNNPQSMSTVQERHREEAELRSVFVLFITPLISVRVTGNKETDRHLYTLLNNIMNLATRELNRFSGHLRQFIVDDKGVVLIATFGLRGSTFPNMVAERALPATITLHNAMQNELGVQNQVGATIGSTYCGVVGGIKRHEYAVMGPSVNLAARLMSSPKNPGILVDYAVRMAADRSYAFNALPPVKAKGYSEPVPIFEPLSPLERSWGRVQPNFVGRKEEIMCLKGMAREMALTQCPSKIVYITGESGMGKSTLVVHAIEHVRKLMSATRRRVIVTKHVSKESDLLVPFGIFRSILVNVLTYFKISQDDRSLISHSSSNGIDSIGWESLSGASQDASEATGFTRSADRLALICRELNAPLAFEELVGHHLLGGEYKSRELFKSRGKGSNMKSLVTFMAKAFKRCTQDASLVLVALDDVHNMDEMSWRVVQELFETHNILFLCISRPLSTYRLLVDSSFWDKLNDTYQRDGRFQIMTVDRLQDAEVKTMTAKTLGLQEADISSTLMNDVLMQSNGMPHFANEILETMKRQSGNDSRFIEEMKGNVTFASVGELLLHRIDSFDAPIRDVLNLGAVLGSSFEMKVLVAVLRQMNKEQADFKTVLDKAKSSLDVAVSEGILYVIQEGGDFSDEGIDDITGESTGLHESSCSFDNPSPSLESLSSNLVYTFCHDIWRTTILNLMLDSRKRDMHLIIAITLEKQEGQNADDYLSRMKLFSHWKASGESKKATSLALSIGKSFEELGLQDQSIKVFEDALDMWNVSGNAECKCRSIQGLLR